MKFNENYLLKKHFLNFVEIVRKLRSVGAKLEEIDIADFAEVTLEFVKEKFLDQETKMKNSDNSSNENI